MSTLAAALSGLAILLVGGGIGYFLGRLRQSASDARRDEIQDEYDAYRKDVAEHFSKTADQFHAIGLQYRELYEHLATGSASLCELEPPAERAPFPPAIEAREPEAEANEAADEPPETTAADAASPADGTDRDAAADPESAAAEAAAEPGDAGTPAPDNVVELVRPAETATDDQSDDESDDESDDPDEQRYR